MGEIALWFVIVMGGGAVVQAIDCLVCFRPTSRCGSKHCRSVCSRFIVYTREMPRHLPLHTPLEIIVIAPKCRATDLRNKCSWVAYPGGTCTCDWSLDRPCILMATSYLRLDTTAYGGERACPRCLREPILQHFLKQKGISMHPH